MIPEDVRDLLIRIAPLVLEPLSAHGLRGIDIPQILTDLIIMIFQQERGFDHEDPPPFPLLPCDPSADIVLHRRMDDPIQSRQHLGPGKDDPRHFLPIDLPLGIQDLPPQQIQDRSIATPLRSHHLMAHQIRLDCIGIIALPQIVEHRTLSGPHAACYPYDLHLFRLIPVFSLVHIHLQGHGQLGRAFHLLLQYPKDRLYLILMGLHQQFIMDLQDQL